MTAGLRARQRYLSASLLLAIITLATCGSMLFAEESKTEDRYSRQFWADARIYSLLPGEELASFRGDSNGGGVGPGGTLGLGISSKQRQFNVEIVAKRKAQRFLAHVTVRPDEEDMGTRAQEIDYDLTDLNPQSLELARDEDGRVYRLSLVPRIIQNPKPWQFKAEDLRLEYWSFPSSPVILNDQDYIGRLSMSSGPIAWCDIPGLAKIEFSLLHLKDAKPMGTLEKGVINIAHEGTTLRISDVKNGVNTEALTGGPYQVWVRWAEPTQTVEEYRQSLKQQIASLKERVKNDELTLPLGTLKRLEQMSESNRIGLIGSGLRGVEDGDLATLVE